MTEVRQIIGFGFLILGIAVTLSPNEAIMTPAHEVFFGAMPRVPWGIFIALVGLVSLFPRIARTGTAFAAVISLTWMGVAVAPLMDNLPWNVVSAVVWLMVAVLCAYATVSKKD